VLAGCVKNGPARIRREWVCHYYQAHTSGAAPAWKMRRCDFAWTWVSDEVVYEGTASDWVCVSWRKLSYYVKRAGCSLLRLYILILHHPWKMRRRKPAKGRRKSRARIIIAGDKEETGGRLSRLQICASVRRAWWKCRRELYIVCYCVKFISHCRSVREPLYVETRFPHKDDWIRFCAFFIYLGFGERQQFFKNGSSCWHWFLDHFSS
jgi:hypothetical protein